MPDTYDISDEVLCFDSLISEMSLFVFPGGKCTFQ